MTRSRITIKDLAKELNLSTSTISRALHNHPSIGKKTTQDVWKLAAKLGYFPNSVASNLRKNKTNLIGIIVPRIDVYFHSRVISGVEEVAYKLGYNIIICQSNDSYEREVTIIQTLLTNMVEGVIGCVALETKNCSHYSRFKDYDIPLVFFDRVSYEIESSKVIIDDYEAAFKATEYLAKTGCKRIAHIAGCQNTGIFQARLEGYKAAIRKYNLPVVDELVEVCDDLSFENGHTCSRKLLKSPLHPDGIFCANDNTAISAIQVAKSLNLRIPNDVSIIGFSNYPNSTIIEPALTTIDDRAFEMGQAAAKLLIRQIEDKDSIIASETIVIRTDIIERESTRSLQK